MDLIMKEIMSLAKDGDLEKVRHILRMNLKDDYKLKFYKKVIKLPLRKKVIIQNLDMLSIFDIVEHHGYEKFNMKFWKKAITYYIAVGDNETLQRLGHDLTLEYGEDFIEYITYTDFDSPKGDYTLRISPYNNDVEVLEYLIIGINEASSQLQPETIAKYFGIIFTEDYVDISNIPENVIRDYAYLLVRTMEFNKSNIHRKLKGEPRRILSNKRK